MSNSIKYKPLVSVKTSSLTLNDKYQQAFDRSLAELVDLSLGHSGSAQVARGFLLNLRGNKNLFEIASLRKFDSKNKQNVFNLLNVFMSSYKNISQFVVDEQYWLDIEKHYNEVLNE